MQAVNHLSPYAGFRLLPLQEHMLSTFCYMYNCWTVELLELVEYVELLDYRTVGLLDCWAVGL